MAKQAGAKVIKAGELENLKYELPESLVQAHGMLKGKRIDPLKYQRSVRQGWTTRDKQFRKISEITVIEI